MSKKQIVMLFFVFILFYAVSSCTPGKGTGLLGPKAIQPTVTPTCTPDASYSVLIHQQGTPAVGVALSMVSTESGTSVTATTGTDGTAGFDIHCGGQWELGVDSFNGFDSQKFTVEPLSNTSYAVDYGIPTLNLELVSGNEMIPIAPSTLVYKITYHTNYPRYVELSSEAEKNLTIDYQNQGFRYDNDSQEFTINIAKSFENYSTNDKTLDIVIEGKPTTGNSVFSNARTLTKNWRLNMSAEFHYMAVYNFGTNKNHTVYYAGIRDIDLSLSYNIFFNGAVNYEAVGAGNSGDAGMNSPTYYSYFCMPGVTDFGCFSAAAYIPTEAGWIYACSHPDNNGWMTVRIYDSGNLDVTRTFSTNNNWGTTCCYYDCILLGNPGGPNYVCGTVPPGGACSMGFKFEPRDIYRQRQANINITK
ncbi:MAG: hypothetical protein LLG37_01795 [Spirochaetia bacterium]|nr:hypothetical protein [Spirochaetia bacterium]